jgi:hypothetical protein
MANTMKRIIVLLIFQICLTCALYAQHAVSSTTWQLLNTFSVKTQNNKYVLYFPPELKALDNKVVQLPGYMVPIKVGKEHKEFMLSVLPVEQCAFCGSGDYPPMVLINMQKPVPYKDKVVIVKGNLMLNKSGANTPEFTIINANIEQ